MSFLREPGPACWCDQGVICVMRVCVYVRRDEGCGDEEELGSHAHRSLFTEIFFQPSPESLQLHDSHSPHGGNGQWQRLGACHVNAKTTKTEI